MPERAPRGFPEILTSCPAHPERIGPMAATLRLVCRTCPVKRDHLKRPVFLFCRLFPM